MNAQIRQWVTENFAYERDSDRTDLLDPTKTTDTLLEFCYELLNQRQRVWANKALIVTAVRSDHPTYDGPNGHSGGNAIDFSQNGPDDAREHLMRDTQACKDARGIGAAGPYKDVVPACGGYGPDSKIFEDNDSDHIHVQVMGY